jgi:prepilin peptidase CpaA
MQMLLTIDKTAATYQWGVVIGVSLIAAFFDLRTRRIPNKLTFPIFFLGLTWSAANGGIVGFGNSIAASALLALPFVILFLAADGGAGDAKLMAAIGAWLGLKQGILALVCVAVAGIVLALARAMAAKRLQTVLKTIYESLKGIVICVFCFRTKPYLFIENTTENLQVLTIPYGAAILAGVSIAGGIILL